jgi:hypothetical protein
MKKNRRRPNPLALSLRPPFTKDEWHTLKVSDVVASRVFHDYYERCVAQVFQSPRRDTYVTMLVSVTHAGRLTEFAPRSFGRFLEEAENQPLTTRKLENTLEAIVGGITSLRLSPVEQFEFLAVVGGFTEHTAKLIGTTDRLKELTDAIMTLALMSLVLAVNAVFGLDPRVA